MHPKKFSKMHIKNMHLEVGLLSNLKSWKCNKSAFLNAQVKRHDLHQWNIYSTCECKHALNLCGLTDLYESTLGHGLYRSWTVIKSHGNLTNPLFWMPRLKGMTLINEKLTQHASASIHLISVDWPTSMNQPMFQPVETDFQSWQWQHE